MREPQHIGSREHQAQKLSLMAGVDEGGIIPPDDGGGICRDPNPAWRSAQTVYKPLPPDGLERTVGWALAVFVFGVGVFLGWITYEILGLWL